MAIGNRYNGGGPIAGVLIEGTTDGAGNITAPTGTTSTSPTFVTAAQSDPAFTLITVAAATAGDLLTANANRRGARLTNYTAAPIYFWPTANGPTPPSGAPADVVPAAASGLPGQYEFPYAPTVAFRYVGASAGATIAGLGVQVW
jgi:hypothetical protein